MWLPRKPSLLDYIRVFHICYKGILYLAASILTAPLGLILGIILTVASISLNVLSTDDIYIKLRNHIFWFVFSILFSNLVSIFVAYILCIMFHHLGFGTKDLPQGILIFSIGLAALLQALPAWVCFFDKKGVGIYALVGAYVETQLAWLWLVNGVLSFVRIRSILLS